MVEIDFTFSLYGYDFSREVLIIIVGSDFSGQKLTETQFLSTAALFWLLANTRIWKKPLD